MARRKEEWVDVVDGRDRVIGRDSHARVHDWNVGLLHRSVHAFLLDDQGKLFIQQRARNRRLAPGQWDCSIGEHVKSGESYGQGVRRGLREELGVTKKIKLRKANKEIIEDIRKKKYDNKEWSTLYAGTWNGKIVLSDETQQAKWATVQELKKMVREHPKQFTVFFRTHFRKWVKLHGSGKKAA